MMRVRAGYGASMRVLVTNDDGIESPGIAALPEAIQQAGHDTVVVAPEDDRSGASASLGRIVPQHQFKVRRVGYEWDSTSIEACTIAAPPGLIAMAAVLGAFGDPPDVVASGVTSDRTPATRFSTRAPWVQF
jgi:5'-nucleotidase